MRRHWIRRGISSFQYVLVAALLILVVVAGITLLGSRTVPDLDAGAASSGSTTVTIPSGVAPGLYYLIARADADNAVAVSFGEYVIASRRRAKRNGQRRRP